MSASGLSARFVGAVFLACFCLCRRVYCFLTGKKFFCALREGVADSVV